MFLFEKYPYNYYLELIKGMHCKELIFFLKWNQNILFYKILLKIYFFSISRFFSFATYIYICGIESDNIKKNW